mmetsp:Transcript_5344/g.6229  ORF Transcript_5344/g.6229 Transcript_5344/m.6229 type:complete len:319 (-) Transcript_5344:1501-2457(-)|eukprot:CAMPEP_0184016352 /NCGR_PEP_ID=MMETSP0954-20121128/6882_1 /TAXON_ID=627963 /ORGANISM="Aplanochytrium sp, Strain PBS07" /LENGTH=318 /DNA_ID=CAMNT_0026297365 /DNA_START=115 /DNA_END=1071 /DNA_ORIENTATION=-
MEDQTSDDLMVMLQKKGLNERWAIRREEMKVEPKIFAKGAGGELYRCKWRGLDCVAKTLGVKGSEDKEKRIYKQNLVDLANEIKVLSTLRHPHLVMFLGACFQVGEAPVLLIEFCSGGNLERLLIRHTANATKVKMKDAIKISSELAIGLNFLHQCKPPVVHRDLKPANILLTSDNRVKITDFGLSKFIAKRGDEQNDKYQMTGETGSYRFMAPEVFQHKTYNEKVDVYSYAVIVYWIFSGYKPYANFPTPIEAAESVAVKNNRPNIGHIKHEGMAAILADSWDADPDKRPSFDKIVKEISRFMEGSNNHDRKSCRLQ